MSSKSTPVIVIAGPTASGKTHLAVSLASQYNCEIISADSRQIYRNMDLGTGKDIHEYTINGAKIPYHLIDIAEPEDIYTLYHYQQDCYKAIENISKRQKTSLLCGGTGLYIEAVLKNYKIPNVPENPEYRYYLNKKSKEELIEKLKQANRHFFNSTDIKSKKRIIRSLEIHNYSLNNKIDWGVKSPPKLMPLVLITRWERETLIKRIDHRLQQRIDEGMIEEVKQLIASGITYERLSLFGMEYRQLAEHLINNKSLESTITDLATEIHRLAKRQMTYFKGLKRRGLDIHWIDNASFAKAQPLIDSFLSDNKRH